MRWAAFASFWEHTLLRHPMLLQDMWATAHMGSLWLRSFWKPREPERSTQDALATMIKEENLRSEASWFLEGPGRHQPRPSLFWSVEETPGLMVLVEKAVPSGLMLGLFPRSLCWGKAATFSNMACHFSLLWLKYQMYVWSQPVSWLKFLHFMSCLYWRKWPGLAPEAAALSYRRIARFCSWWLPGGSQRSAAAGNRMPPWWTGRSRPH